MSRQNIGLRVLVSHPLYLPTSWHPGTFPDVLFSQRCDQNNEGTLHCSNKLPVIAENCPACFEAPKERHRTKQLLASQELLFPHLYNSIMAAMKPVMAISRTGRSFTQAAAKEGDEEEEDIDAV